MRVKRTQVMPASHPAPCGGVSQASCPDDIVCGVFGLPRVDNTVEIWVDWWGMVGHACPGPLGEGSGFRL